MSMRASPLVLLLLFLPHFSFSGAQEPRYAFFTLDATRFAAENEYDYIVVGGGTSGCPLAASLSESHSVLLLERGGSPVEYPDLATQEGFLRTLVSTDAYNSPAQAFTSDEGVPNTRGRILGGSSAINAGFYSRADPTFYRVGGNSLVKWDMALVNASYKWVEHAITFRPNLSAWQSAFRDGLLQAHVSPYNGFTVHHLQGTKIGATTFDRTGRRRSSADLLDLAKPENIRVALRANVERVLLSSRANGGRGRQLAVVGVAYRDSLGNLHRARTARGGEVVLCAGALGSPQILLLSGIGPRKYLTSMGIAVAHHHPHVGKFMYDNPRNGISITTPIPLEQSLIQVVGITRNGSFIEAASNIVPFVSSGRSSFLHRPPSLLYMTVATVIEKVAGPISAGSLRLATRDARDNPAVRFNYFSERVDLARCVRGVRKVRELMDTRAIGVFRFPDWFGGSAYHFVGDAPPGAEESDEVVEEFCRRTVATLWHYHGGCVVGKVVDGRFRVVGIRRLRVVDGSTLPVSPGTNPQATLLMLGRYVGEKMKAERIAKERRIHG